MPTLLGKNIKHLRKERKLSQGELASQLGISRNKVASYESKGIEPRLNLLKELADYFDISVEALINKDLSSTPKDSRRQSSFDNSSLSEKTPASILLYDQSKLSKFINKNTSMQKMLEGFHLFYKMKLSTYDTNEIEGIDDIKSDIENLLFLVEYLLKENKTLIKELSPA